jgi:predicted DNA-binding transcriptional regulator YafY
LLDDETLAAALGLDLVAYAAIDELEWLARYLLALPWPFEVLEPRELRTIVRRRARAVGARHR